MSNLEDREALARVIARTMPGWNEDTSEPMRPGWSEELRLLAEQTWVRINEECLRQGRIYADAILAAGFHRTPAPAPDAQALIAFIRDAGLASVYGRLDAREAAALCEPCQLLLLLAEHDRVVAERAWEEGARWAAVEFGNDASVDEGRVVLVPSDNPYRKEQA